MVFQKIGQDTAVAHGHARRASKIVFVDAGRAAVFVVLPEEADGVTPGDRRHHPLAIAVVHKLRRLGAHDHRD